MDFWIIFVALLIALFSIGRLFTTDPDNSLSKRSEEQLKKLQTDLMTNEVGIFRKIIYAIMYISYLPYVYPMAGLVVSCVMIMSIVFI